MDPFKLKEEHTLITCINKGGLMTVTILRDLLGLLFFANFVLAGCAISSTKQLVEPGLISNEKIILGEQISFYSKTLNETRSYLIHLPKSYNDESIFPKKYPVLYVLDGESHFEYASGISDFMGSSGITNNYQIPELIVVAIPNKDPGKDNRFRDYSPTLVRDYYEGSGGGDLFRKLLSEEIIPHIESNYRTIPLRVLAGHSMGGLLAVYDLLGQEPICNAYIAMDPSLWWDNQLMFAKAQELKGGTLRSHLYLSTYDNAQRKEESREFVATLTKKNPAPFRSKFQVFESEGHGSLPIVSLYNGLRFIFDGFRPDLNNLVEDPSAIGRHFRKFSKTLGVDILPPEDLISSVCNETVKENPDKAIACFQVNVLNYPESYNAQNALANAYAKKGRVQEAIQSYRKSLELKSNNVGAVNGLSKLNEK